MLEKMKEMALDTMKNASDHEKVIQTMNDFIRYAEDQDLEYRKIVSDNEKINAQLEKARETNLKLFEQVTVQKSVEDEVDEDEDVSKPLSEQDILKELGGSDND